MFFFLLLSHSQLSQEVFFCVSDLANEFLFFELAFLKFLSEVKFLFF